MIGRHAVWIKETIVSAFRVGVGGFWHESNSFCPVPTTLRDFTSYSGVLVGRQILTSGRRDEVAGATEVLRQDGRIDIAPLVSAEALPAGYITDEAVACLEENLRRELRESRGLDGVCFTLHGAMVAVSVPDLDGYFLNVLREEVGPDVPIVCALDSHAVITQQMMDLTTAFVAYRTHPHEDVVETGMRAAHILLDALDGKTRPVMRSQKLPMLFAESGTGAGALKELHDRFIAWDDRGGVIACSLCPSFPWQDVPEQGWVALAVTDDDEALADQLARELAQACWDARYDLLPKPPLSPEDAVRKAAAAPGCPVVITDSADNVGGGGGGDNTVMLETLLKLRHKVDGLILHHIPDPEAVSQVKGARIGETVTVTVGGKRDHRFSRPLRVAGRVLCVTEGPITDDGGFTMKPLVETGGIVCLGVDNVRLVLTERLMMGPQPSLFRKVGIEPFKVKIVALKTGIGYKVTYDRAATAVIPADCPGALSTNMKRYDLKNVPRPIFPIDPETEWSPSADLCKTELKG